MAYLIGFQYVAAVAAGADAYQHVALVGGAAQQACEDVLITIVVADGCEVGGVAVESLGVERRTVEIEASAQFGGEMLCVGRAAAIAAEMYFATGTERTLDKQCGIRHGLHKPAVGQDALLDGNTLFY